MPSITTQNQLPKKLPIWSLILIIVTASSLFIIFGLLASSVVCNTILIYKQSKGKFIPPQTLSTAPADWITYRSDLAKFEIKYPKDWQAQTISYYEHVFQVKEAYKYDIANVEIKLEDIITWENMVNQLELEIDGITQKVEYAGLSGLSRSGITLITHPTFKGKEVKEVILRNPDMMPMWRFTAIGSENIKVLDQMLSTFKLSKTKLSNPLGNHGCNYGGGYSWCEVKQKCLRVTEERCTNPSTTNSELEDWETYQDNIGLYTIKYPSSYWWYPPIKDPGTLSEISLYSKLDTNNNMKVTVYQDPEHQNLSELEQSFKKLNPKITIETIEINSIEWLKAKEQNDPKVVFYTIKDGKRYALQIDHFDEAAISTKIFSTITFMKPPPDTSAWKDYNGVFEKENMVFSFMYPPAYSFERQRVPSHTLDILLKDNSKIDGQNLVTITIVKGKLDDIISETAKEKTQTGKEEMGIVNNTLWVYNQWLDESNKESPHLLYHAYSQLDFDYVVDVGADIILKSSVDDIVYTISFLPMALGY